VTAALLSACRGAPERPAEEKVPSGTILLTPAQVQSAGIQVDTVRFEMVSLPLTVHVYMRAAVVNGNLGAGTVLEAGQLGEAEVDVAAAPGVALRDPGLAVGRTLARNLNAGAPVRVNDLKARQYFAAGETVRVVALGSGWQVVTEGQAMNAGVEGQTARVRTESGRILNARPSGDRQVELTL